MRYDNDPRVTKIGTEGYVAAQFRCTVKGQGYAVTTDRGDLYLVLLSNLGWSIRDLPNLAMVFTGGLGIWFSSAESAIDALFADGR